MTEPAEKKVIYFYILSEIFFSSKEQVSHIESSIYISSSISLLVLVIFFWTGSKLSLIKYYTNPTGAQMTSFNWRRWWNYWTRGTRHRFLITNSQRGSSLSSAPAWTRSKLFRNISKPSIWIMRWNWTCNSTWSASVCRQTCTSKFFSISLSSLRRFHCLNGQPTHALRLKIWRGILLRSGSTKWRSLRWASRICLSSGKWSRERRRNFSRLLI